MVQGEIIDILEKVKKPLSSREITELLNESFTLVAHGIAKLVKSKEIKIIELTREQASIKFNSNHKRRMRLYYVS